MRFFMAIEKEWFQNRLTPSLRACWLGRSFGPAVEICRELAEISRSFIQRGGEPPVPPLTLLVPDGLTFDRDRWRALTGELLLFSAAELPEIETPLESYSAVLGLEMPCFQGDFTPIQQAILGSRDLPFGGAYRPDAAGWNDLADVERLRSWLAEIDAEEWSSAGLTHVPAEERDDELAFLREWFPELVAMYRRCGDSRYVLVCEEI
jgi:hypothetical protein